MKNIWNKGLAALLTASMLLVNINGITLAEETTEGTVTEVQETEPPATEPQTTEAPATEPQTTEAPATEPQTTEASATDPQTTEAPATEPQTTETPVTEAPATEAAAESQTTEQQTTESQEEETETESETEKGVFCVEEKGYTVEVKLPEDMELPEGTELTAEVLKSSDESYKDSLELAEEECGASLEEYLIYDIHFEKDGKEAELEERSKEDISVTFTFEDREFKNVDFGDTELKAYHIRDMKPEELEEARAAAEDSEQELQELPEQKAVGLELEQETEGEGVIVSFKTDGFSNYVFGIPAEQGETGTEEETESEAQTSGVSETETETESEAETETETESETEAKTEAATEKAVEVLGEAAQVTPVNDDDAQSLTINFTVLGTATAASHPLVITGDADKAVAQEQVVVEINEKEVTGEAVYDTKANELKIYVPAEITSAEITVTGLADGTYTIDAGGNYIDNSGALKGSADYSSYTDTGTTHGETPVQFTLPLTGTATAISVTDRYTKIAVSLTDKTAKAGITDGVLKVQRQLNGEWQDVANTSMTTTNGAASITGLPFGTYRVVCESVPGVYVYQSVSTPVEKELSESALAVTASFATTQIAVRVRAVDPDGNRLSGAEFNLAGYTLTSSDNILRGVLERGVPYSLKQTVAPYGYVKAANLMVTPGDASNIQTVELVNTPTVVQVSALSKLDGSRIAGVGFEIRDSSGNTVCSWTSASDAQVWKAKLQPGVKYTLVETSVPDGYYLASSKTFTVSRDGSVDTVTVTNDATKVSISRKGYDSRTQASDGTYEYTNRKMLSGAVLEVRDLNGNTIERWTSTEEPYVITGKLAAGGTYLLVEITTPAGYEKGGQGEFVVKTKEKAESTKNIVTSVTMQTRRANGKIQVVKRAALNGTAIKLDQTYYCALFLDEAKTQMYSEGGVKALNMTSDTVYASATFSNIPAGVYYAAETDRNGNVLKGSESSPSYTITTTNEKLNLSAGMSLLAEIVNDYEAPPAGGYTTVSTKELADSYAQEYADYGGSAEAAAAMAAGDGTVATGDTTNIAIYVILLAAAVLVVVFGIFIRKKKK